MHYFTSHSESYSEDLGTGYKMIFVSSGQNSWVVNIKTKLTLVAFPLVYILCKHYSQLRHIF